MNKVREARSERPASPGQAESASARLAWALAARRKARLRLTPVDLVRLIRLQNRYSYFVLNAPGKRLEYLICRCCGSVMELPGVPAVRQIDERISSTHGYSAVYHEFGFYGICPDCRSKQSETRPTTKLPAGFRSEPSPRNLKPL